VGNRHEDKTPARTRTKGHTALTAEANNNLDYDETPREPALDYHALNAKLNLVGDDGKLQLDADHEAARQFFLQHVNHNTVYFDDLEKKIDYLITNHYYEREFIEQYDWAFVKDLYKRAYSYKFRFPTFMGAFKYYSSYTLKTFDGKRYLERYEDRVVANALYLGRGDETLATNILDEIMTGRYQPATPTFLNAGKAQRGELVSCFLVRLEDNLESISRSITNALQLSKRGGGVALLLTNIRETGAPIKRIENQSSGIVPVMKLLEDSFSYANQLGARQGAGAVYLSAHHPDIMKFLDTKRENADEKIRIKTLSLGVVIPDITFELAKNNDDMYLFSPYDVERVYGTPMSDISITEKYHEMVENPDIRKTKIKARRLFQVISEISMESGYPYLLFEDTATKANPLNGRINMSNLCVSGDTRLLTDKGYRRFDDLYESQEDFMVLSDNRSVNEDFSDATVSLKNSTKMFLTKKDAEVFKVSTKEGFEIKATEWHKFPVEADGRILVKRLCELEVGDHLLVQPKEGVFGPVYDPDVAYDNGSALYWSDSITWGGDKETVQAYVCGAFKVESMSDLFDGSHSVESTNKQILQDIQTLTLNLGLFSTISYTDDDTYLLQVVYDSDFTATVTGVEFYSIEDVYDVTVNDGHTITCNGITTRNCSEILQTNEASEYNPNGSYSHVGKDISCNLGSLNIAKTFDSPDFAKTIETGIRALTSVSDLSNIDAVPSVENGNHSTHSIGLGMMNLHGFLAREHIHYDSPEAVEFAGLFAYAFNYWSIVASNKIAKETGQVFDGFDTSEYANGTYFNKYIEKNWGHITSPKISALLGRSSIYLPTQADWEKLKNDVMEHGLYNGYRLCIPPTGSISYLNYSTASIHPIISPIEIRKEGKLGRVYAPAPYLSDDTLPFYRDAYKIGPEAIINMYAAMTPHIDQGLSLTLFWPDTATTRDMNKAYIYAWRKGIKTIYYARIRQLALEGTQVEGTAAGYCESCQL
jgi:ribonucleoside-diphosphate reductase